MLRVLQCIVHRIREVLDPEARQIVIATLSDTILLGTGFYVPYCARRAHHGCCVSDARASGGKQYGHLYPIILSLISHKGCGSHRLQLDSRQLLSLPIASLFPPIEHHIIVGIAFTPILLLFIRITVAVTPYATAAISPTEIAHLVSSKRAITHNIINHRHNDRF